MEKTDLLSIKWNQEKRQRMVESVISVISVAAISIAGLLPCSLFKKISEK